MIKVHDHPALGEPGLRKESYEELVVRVADAQRAAEHHLRVRYNIVDMLREPSLGMIREGQAAMDNGEGPGGILDAMVTRGLLELLESGKL